MKKLKIITIFLLFAFILCACGSAINGTSETKHFTLIVDDSNGNEKTYQLDSNKTTVGDALIEKGLISGEKGQYGLYVTTVDGITSEYDKDGMYWAFYINGEYAMTGVENTEIEQDAVYTFKIEK